jgi:hypothetical protein
MTRSPRQIDQQPVEDLSRIGPHSDVPVLGAVRAHGGDRGRRSADMSRRWGDRIRGTPRRSQQAYARRAASRASPAASPRRAKARTRRAPQPDGIDAGFERPSRGAAPARREQRAGAGRSGVGPSWLPRSTRWKHRRDAWRPLPARPHRGSYLGASPLRQ